MITVMALLKSNKGLTDRVIEANLARMREQAKADAPILGRVFNRVMDRSQKGIEYARGGFELDAISQFFFADVSSSMTVAKAGTMNLAMGLPEEHIDELQLILCLQTRVIEPPAGKRGLKRMSILRKRPDISAEEFQDQWFNLHSLLVKRLPGIEGYRQNLVLDGPRDKDGHMLADGMVELWFPDGATIDAAFRSGIGITTMTHAKEFISEITTYLVQPIEISGVS